MQHEINQTHNLVIDNKNASFSIRFTAPENLSLKAMGLFCASANEPPALIASLFKDKGGNPSGKRLAFASVVPSAGNWTTFFMQDAPLTQGKIYHLVLEFDALRGGKHPVGEVDKDHFAAFTATGPSHRARPRDGALDPEEAVLVLNNKKWKKQDLDPVYMAWGQNDKLFGNPMNDFGAAPVHGNGTPDDPTDDLWQSQAIHFNCGTRGTSLRVRLRTVGKPSSPLHLDVLRHDYLKHEIQPQYNMVAATVDQVGNDWQWLQVKFPLKDEEFKSFSPDCHYFSFHSTAGKADGESCSDCWQISWSGATPGVAGVEDLTFDGGAHHSRAAWSTNNKFLHDQFHRDLNLVIESEPCKVFSNESFTPVPTPDYLP